MVRWFGATTYSDTAGRDNSCDTRSGHPGTGGARAVGTGAISPAVANQSS